MLTGINNVTVFVKDTKKAIDFYTNKLGMSLTVNDPKIDHYEVAAGPNCPGIVLWEDAKSVGKGTDITFKTDDIKATCDTLRANGVRVTEPYEAHGRWWAGFKDLDGNSFGLTQE